MLNLNLTPHCHISLPYIMGIDITINHQRIQTTRSHTTPSSSIIIHVNTTYVIDITCVVVATSVILWGLELYMHGDTQCKPICAKANHKYVVTRHGDVSHGKV